MRLAIHSDGATVRGNERQLLHITEGMIARGHHVAVACREGTPVADAFRAAGAATTGIRPRGDVDVVSLARFSAWLRRERPDALLLASWKRFPAAAAAARLAGVPRIVLRVGVQQPVPESGLSGWKYRHAFAAGIDAVVANAAGLGAYFAGLVPALADRVHVVRNAAAVTRAAPGDLRREVGAAPDDAVLLAVGGLERRKGFDLLIGALARLGGSVHLAVAGEGPERDALVALAVERNVADRVHLLGQRTDVPALLAASDGFVLSSRADSMANAMLEAMAAGVPVIATDVHGTEDALAATPDRVPAGWIVPRGDEDALARAMAEVVAGGTEVYVRGAEARWRIENWFTVERMVDGYEAVLFGARMDGGG